MNKFELLTEEHLSIMDEIYRYLFNNGFEYENNLIETWSRYINNEKNGIATTVVTIDLWDKKVHFKKMAFPTETCRSNKYYKEKTFDINFKYLHDFKIEINKCFEKYDFETLENDIEDDADES